jgi:hypothetical protein
MNTHVKENHTRGMRLGQETEKEEGIYLLGEGDGDAVEENRADEQAGFWLLGSERGRSRRAPGVHFNGRVCMKMARIFSIAGCGPVNNSACIPIRRAPSTFSLKSSKNNASSGAIPSRSNANR